MRHEMLQVKLGHCIDQPESFAQQTRNDLHPLGCVDRLKIYFSLVLSSHGVAGTTHEQPPERHGSTRFAQGKKFIERHQLRREGVVN